MGRLNFLVEGISGTGKTSVCRELERRGIQALNGDTDLAYQGDPATGKPHTGEPSHDHHIWPVEQVRAIADDSSEPMTFFCGGSRNFEQFLDVFDEVFVLDVDPTTLRERLGRRPADEFGSKPSDQDFILALQASGADVPSRATVVDATKPLLDVVDSLLARAAQHQRLSASPTAAKADAHMGSSSYECR